MASYSTTTVTPGQRDAMMETLLQDMVTQFGEMVGPIAAAGAELCRLFPDSVTFGSFLLFFLTQNQSYGVFSLFLFETSLVHRLISFIAQQTYGDTGATKNPSGASCASGFRNPSTSVDRMRVANNQTIPPFPFFVGAVLSYLSNAISGMKQTLDVMGPEWSGRFYFIVIMLPIITLLLLVLYYMYGCFTLTSLGTSLIIGCLIGALLYFANLLLFGPEGMNFLGLPYLVDKAGTGEPIYICSATPITPPGNPVTP